MNVFSEIKKRDGKVVDFNPNKITIAIFNAAKSVGGHDKDMAKKLTDQVVDILEQQFLDTIPEVEDVQDIVENVLIENSHTKTAKAYILNRKQHEHIRKTRSMLVDVQKTIRNYLFIRLSITTN